MENNYSSFKENLRKDVQELLGSEFVVGFNAVEKMNESYDALTVKLAEDCVGININATALFKAYEKGDSYESIIHKASDMAKEAIANRPDFDLDSYSDYSVMKDKLAIEVVSKERNAKLLETVPHKDFEDMAIIYRFIIEISDSMGTGSILVTNDLLDRYGITKEQLHEDAIINAPEIRPLIIGGMGEVLAKQMGAENCEDLGYFYPPEEERMFVASVKGSIHGAGCIAYQDFMDKASERAGGSFFILPSSIHEVLIIPDTGEFTLENLEKMVREVNATTVSPEDKLTDSVYHYDSKNKIFELGEKYIERTASSEKEAV